MPIPKPIRNIPREPHTHNNSFSQRGDNYYSAVSNKSEKILDEYKSRVYTQPQEVLDESYTSDRSPFGSLSPPKREYGKETLHTQDLDGRLSHAKHAETYSMHIPNSLELVGDENFSSIEQKFSTFNEGIRHYIEKCKLLESQINEKDQISANRERETVAELQRSQANMDRLRHELIASEKANQEMTQECMKHRQQINNLQEDNISLTKSLKEAQEKVADLNNELKSEIHFNRRDNVITNLTQQIQEISQLKKNEVENTKQLQMLQQKVSDLSRIISDTELELEKTSKINSEQSQKLKSAY